MAMISVSNSSSVSANWLRKCSGISLEYLFSTTDGGAGTKVACNVRRGDQSKKNQNPNLNIVAVDLWVKNYAGFNNPGEDFVREELKKFNFKGKIKFINKN